MSKRGHRSKDARDRRNAKRRAVLREKKEKAKQKKLLIQNLEIHDARLLHPPEDRGSAGSDRGGGLPDEESEKR